MDNCNVFVSNKIFLNLELYLNLNIKLKASASGCEKKNPLCNFVYPIQFKTLGADFCFVLKLGNQKMS